MGKPSAVTCKERDTQTVLIQDTRRKAMVVEFNADAIDRSWKTVRRDAKSELGHCQDIVTWLTLLFSSPRSQMLHQSNISP